MHEIIASKIKERKYSGKYDQNISFNSDPNQDGQSWKISVVKISKLSALHFFIIMRTNEFI
jgi:hypothetical protein